MSAIHDFSFEGSTKNNIQLAFSKAAINYDTLALFQKEVADELLSKYLNPPCPPFIKWGEGGFFSILDIGCGTGFLSYGLADKFPDTDIFGCDISHSMIKVARSKYHSGGQWSVNSGQNNKNIHFLTSDGGILPYKNETFDMAISNLTYQWIGNLEGSFREAYRVLKPGGIFIFSTLGPETLKELRQCYLDASKLSLLLPLPCGERKGVRGNGLPQFMDFAEKEAIQSTLESIGFKNISIETTNMIKIYPDMWGLLKNIKSIGAGNPFKDGDKSLARGSILKKMAEIYERKFGVQGSGVGVRIPHPNCIYATYEVMFVKASKL